MYMCVYEYLIEDSLVRMVVIKWRTRVCTRETCAAAFFWSIFANHTHPSCASHGTTHETYLIYTQSDSDSIVV